MNSIWLPLPLQQIKAVEAERDAPLAVHPVGAPAAMSLDIKGIGPVVRCILFLQGLLSRLPVDNRR